MNRRIVAQRLAGQLFSTEEAVDNSLALLGELIAAMPRARLEARLAAAVGQDALDLVLEAARGLAGARKSLIAAHGALASAAAEVGLGRVVMVGGGDKSLIDLPTGEAVGLRARRSA